MKGYNFQSQRRRSTAVTWIFCGCALLEYFQNVDGFRPSTSHTTWCGRRSVILNRKRRQFAGLKVQSTEDMLADDSQVLLNDAKMLTTEVAKDADSFWIQQGLESKASESELESSRQFPFSLIVGNDLAKQALLLAASNPKGLGTGVLLYGGHGTGKSALCRSLQGLLVPPGGNESSVPFVTVPLHCQEDALLGTIDLERSIQQGVAVLEPGLLARAHDGILYIDDIHLLDEGLIHILLTAVTDGYVTVEREGMSVRYPCRPLLLASYNPTEAGGGDELPAHWTDRIAMTIPMTDGTSMTVPERVQVVQQVEAFVDKTLSHEQVARLEAEESDLRRTIIEAQKLLPNVELTREQRLYLCEEATRADCQGQRAEIYAAEIAKTSAALDKRLYVNAGDLQRAVLFAIIPRARVLLGGKVDMEEEDQSMEAPPPPPSIEDQQPQPQINEPPPPDLGPENNASEDVENENKDMEETEPDESEEEDSQEDQDEEEELFVPDHFLFGVDAVPLDPELLDYQQWTRRKSKAGKHSKIFNLKRGRFIKALIPKDWKAGKIAVGATLRAAAPYQKFRRLRSPDSKKVHIRNTDFRIQRLARKSGSLILFVVDSSGSMALNRMGAAKGAAMSLLQEAYKNRDKICLISFHDQQAEILVPPTKSMALARNRLEIMPCGGTTPLAHALVTAIRTGLNAVKVKQDVSKVVLVLLADGRPNVPLCVSEGEAFDAALMDPDFGQAQNNQQPSRTYLKEEVLAIAKQLGAIDEFNLLCIDTEDQYVGTGVAKEFTRVAGGSYFHLTPSTATATAVAQIARQGTQHRTSKWN